MRDRSLPGYLRRELSRYVNRRRLTQGPDRPIVSFTFDDVPLSAAESGAPLLVAGNARGTFYVCGAFADGQPGELGPYADWATLRKLSAEGHEIGCHTFGHRNNAHLDHDTLMAEIEQNRAAMLGNGLPAPKTYAFPFGDVSPRAKLTLATRFGILRATWPGIMKTGSDASSATAVTIEGDAAIATAEEWLRRLATGGGWLIFLAHAVTDSPIEYALRPKQLARIIDMCQAAGCEILTIAEAGRRLGLLD